MAIPSHSHEGIGCHAPGSGCTLRVCLAGCPFGTAGGLQDRPTPSGTRRNRKRSNGPGSSARYLLAWENTKTDTALISSGFSVPSKAGIAPRRPLMIDSWIDARSEPQRYKSGRVKFVDPIGS
jgi:hypothetical protein